MLKTSKNKDDSYLRIWGLGVQVPPGAPLTNTATGLQIPQWTRLRPSFSNLPHFGLMLFDDGYSSKEASNSSVFIVDNACHGRHNVSMSALCKIEHSDIGEVCLQGYVHATYSGLVKALGPPHDTDGDKSDAEWFFKLGSGNIVSIYNYKDGRNYNGPEGLPVEDITEWHIGGATSDVVHEVNDLIAKATLHDEA